MPCETPFRDDSEQRLLFKIASCINDGSFIAGVASFNGRSGVVTLTAADVSAALGCTPLCEADGDARYVLKTGDTMTGALSIDNGSQVASTPFLNLSQTWNNAAVTFTGLFSNITNTASNTNSNVFNFQIDGTDRFNFTPGGSFRVVRQDASDSGMNLFLRKRGNAGSATGAVANDSTIGTVAYSGWDGAAFATGSRVSGLASEAWTGIAHGSRIDLYTTPIGSIVEQITLRLSHTGQSQFLDGTAALPSLTFQSDQDTGIYRIGANSIGFSVNGVLAFTVDGTSSTSVGTMLLPNGTAALPALAFASDTNTGIYRVGADILGFSTAGTGRWTIDASGHLIPVTTNLFDIGAAAGPSPRNLFTTGGAVFGPTSGGVSNGNIVLSQGDVFNNILFRSGTTVKAQLAINVSGSVLNIDTASGTVSFRNVIDGGTTLLNIDSTAVTMGSGLLRFNGATSAFPAIKRSGATLQFRLADDSAFAGIATAAIVMSAGAPLSFTSGANTRAGNATLVGGTVTVANTSVTANTVVMLTRKTSGGTLGTAITYTVIAATSFTINSDSALDTSTFSYILIENP